jgi:hypothetical protein
MVLSSATALFELFATAARAGIVAGGFASEVRFRPSHEGLEIELGGRAVANTQDTPTVGLPFLPQRFPHPSRESVFSCALV